MRVNALEQSLFRVLQQLEKARGRIPLILAFGSNQGPRQQALAFARGHLARLFGPLESGPVMETEPWGPVPQDRYLNTVMLGWTLRSPWEVLFWLKKLERQAGRQPGKRWGPRVLDLDLVFYGTLRMQTPHLTLPHPRYHERDFVLRPLLALLQRLGYLKDLRR